MRKRHKPLKRNKKSFNLTDEKLQQVKETGEKAKLDFTDLVTEGLDLVIAKYK